MRKDSIHALDLDSGSIIVKRKFIQFINIHDERIDKESVIIAGTKEDQDLQAYNKEYHQIRDFPPTPVGKKFSYYLKGDMIYEIKKKGLGQGHLYDSCGKEIIVHCIDTAITELGHNAFLRKLDKNFWVLNICSSDSDEDGRWWDINILEKTKHGTMRAWNCGSKLERHPSMFYTTGRYFENYYFDCQWSASEMLQLIHDGYFTQTDLWYRRH